jgi:hypothetical protein
VYPNPLTKVESGSHVKGLAGAFAATGTGALTRTLSKGLGVKSGVKRRITLEDIWTDSSRHLPGDEAVTNDAELESTRVYPCQSGVSFRPLSR